MSDENTDQNTSLEANNPQLNMFGETHTDDLQVLDYLLRNIKGISPVAGEPVDGLPGVDDVIDAMNS